MNESLFWVEIKFSVWVCSDKVYSESNDKWLGLEHCNNPRPEKKLVRTNCSSIKWFPMNPSSEGPFLTFHFFFHFNFPFNSFWNLTPNTVVENEYEKRKENEFGMNKFKNIKWRGKKHFYGFELIGEVFGGK